MARLREARTCYDHLGGRLALDLLDGWATLGWLTRDDLGTVTALTPTGAHGFDGLGVVIPPAPSRPLLRSCLDWSEQHYHLAGALGCAIFDSMIHHNWLSRSKTDRSVEVTTTGSAVLAPFLHHPSRSERTRQPFRLHDPLDRPRRNTGINRHHQQNSAAAV
ncbi:MAG: hypothetical protein ABIR68_02605 [Ilumatobacteraceae bacterium]